MTDRSAPGLMLLARQDVFQLRLSGMILAALVERRVLASREARAIVDEVRDQVPASMDAFRQALEALRAEFPA